MGSNYTRKIEQILSEGMNAELHQIANPFELYSLWGSCLFKGIEIAQQLESQSLITSRNNDNM